MRITRIAAVLAAVFGLLTFAALPAGAIARDTELNETFGAYAVYTGGSDDGAAVYQGLPDGRDLGLVQQSGSYSDPEALCSIGAGGACPIFVLYAGDDPSTGQEECVAATTSPTLVKLKPCSGSTGVNWARACVNWPTCSHYVFINDWATNGANGPDEVLSADGFNGDNFAVIAYSTLGWLQKYDQVSS
jgi:hypothetical protein